MMNLIHNVNSEYQENLLDFNWTFEDTAQSWTSDVMTSIVEISSAKYHEKANSLRIYHSTWQTDAINIYPTNPDKYAFTVPTNGEYVFSMRALVQANVPWLPELVGEFRFIKNGNPLDYITVPFKIGNNTEPEHTFTFRAWQLLYQEVYFLPGIVYTPYIHIDESPTFSPGIFELFLDSFKIEDVFNRISKIASYYTLPQNNNQYIEVDANTTLGLEHESVYVFANDVTITLPSALQKKGKVYKITNGGDGIVTLDAYLAEMIEGEPSRLLGVDSTITLISNGTMWTIQNISHYYNSSKTQWVTNIPNTTIANGASLNILSLITDANKLANGTDNDKYELNIALNSIKTKWLGTKQTHNIRCTYTIATGSDQTFLLELRRTVDNSILGVAQVQRNSDTGLATADFLTYTYGPTDPFVVDGFYLAFRNISGTSVDLTTSLNLLVTTRFK